MKNKLIKLSLVSLLIGVTFKQAPIQANYLGDAVSSGARTAAYCFVGTALVSGSAYGAYKFLCHYYDLNQKFNRLEAKFDEMSNRQLPGIEKSIKALDTKMDKNHIDLKSEMLKCCQQTWAEQKLNSISTKIDTNHREVVGLLNRNGFIPTGDMAGMASYLKKTNRFNKN